MTLNEAIKTEENIAEENQRVVDTGIVFDDVTIDMLYCDDTEVIEEHLANYQRCAEEHRQLAEWLKDYKRLKEQESCEDYISRKAAIVQLSYNKIGNDDYEMIIQDDINTIKALPPVIPKPKTSWIPVSERLPKNEDYVLVCYEDGHIRTAYYYIDNNFYPSEFEDCCETGWYNYNEDFMYRQDVIAWMPLPPSYQGEEGSEA